VLLPLPTPVTPPLPAPLPTTGRGAVGRVEHRATVGRGAKAPPPASTPRPAAAGSPGTTRARTVGKGGPTPPVPTTRGSPAPRVPLPLPRRRARPLLPSPQCRPSKSLRHRQVMVSSPARKVLLPSRPLPGSTPSHLAATTTRPTGDPIRPTPGTRRVTSPLPFSCPLIGPAHGWLIFFTADTTRRYGYQGEGYYDPRYPRPNKPESLSEAIVRQVYVLPQYSSSSMSHMNGGADTHTLSF
jgi:hypothetical protein